MYDDIKLVIYYCVFMENFKNHMKPFGLIKKTVEKDPMAPTYIKSDGTKVIEQPNEFGLTVYEICPDKTLISRTYNKNDQLFVDYIRKNFLEIGHTYDEFGQVIYEFNSLYDEHYKLKQKKEIVFEYHDNGKKSREYIVNTSNEIKIEIFYDENGNKKEKIEHRGTVKTVYDADDKPVKREIDRGSGGIITEDLTNK